MSEPRVEARRSDSCSCGLVIEELICAVGQLYRDLLAIAECIDAWLVGDADGYRETLFAVK